MANDVTSKVIFGLDPSEFRRGIQQVDAKLKQTSDLFNNLGKAIGATFAVGIIQNFAKEAMMLGDQLTKVSQGFDRFGDPAELQKLRYATRGLVSDLELMKQVTMAGNFGIGIKEMGTLLEFATRRAAETGQEVDYLVNSIVTGIGRKSTLILDNLGISASRLKEELHGVSLEMASVSDISAAVGRIASGQLEVMGDAVETATDRMERLNATWDNMKAKAGQFLTRWGVATAEVFGRLVGGYSIIQESNVPVSPGATEPSMFTSPYPTFNFRATPQPNKAPFSPPKLKELKLFQGELNRLTLTFTSQERVMSGHIIPAYDEFNRMIKGAQEQTATFDAQLRAASMVGAEFGMILNEAFSASIISGEDFFETLRKALMDYVKQMAVALATTTALAAIFSVVTGGGFGAAFGAVSQGTGLGNLFGEGGLFNMKATVSGSDLSLGVDRSKNNLRRGGGG
jgi:hypothetical protein